MQTEKPRRWRPAKAYCEAFPALSILDAVRSWYEDKRICEWTNEDGLIIGHIELTKLTEQLFSFKYSFFGTVNVERSSGYAVFGLKMTHVNINYKKPSFACVCGRNAVTLYFVSGRWLCKHCHGLCFLSTRLTPDNRKVLERDDLASHLSAASEKEQRTRAFLNAERKLGRLDRELAAASNHLPAQLRFRSFARWLESDEIPKRSIEPGELGYGWEPGQATGLDIFRMSAEAAGGGMEHALSLVDQATEPFLHSSEIIGVSLFGRDLESFLLDYFDERATEAVKPENQGAKGTLGAGRKTKIKRAASIEPLVLTPAWVIIARVKRDDGDYEFRGSLRFSGSAQLFFAGADTLGVAPALRATIDDDVLTVNVRYQDGDEKAARMALDIARKAIWDQVQAQAPILKEYRRAVRAGSFIESTHRP